MLKSVYLGFRKVKVRRVTVVEFGMYNRGGDGVGCLEVKVGAIPRLKERCGVTQPLCLPLALAAFRTCF